MARSRPGLRYVAGLCHVACPVCVTSLCLICSFCVFVKEEKTARGMLFDIVYRGHRPLWRSARPKIALGSEVILRDFKLLFFDFVYD
jgi:hypothetical protein